MVGCRHLRAVANSGHARAIAGVGSLWPSAGCTSTSCKGAWTMDQKGVVLMMTRSRPDVRIVGLLGWLVLAVGISSANANHSWGGYHWARTANPFTLTLGDNLSSTWDPYLTQ